MTVKSKAAARLQKAFQLQKRYSVSFSDMAHFLGISEKLYRRRLTMAGFDLKILEKLKNNAGTHSAMLKLQAELTNIIEGQGLPDKATADALTALAKSVKSVLELQQEAGGNETDNTIETADLQMTNNVLEMINSKINELADHRANEILRQRDERRSIETANQ